MTSSSAIRIYFIALFLTLSLFGSGNLNAQRISKVAKTEQIFWDVPLELQNESSGKFSLLSFKGCVFNYPESVLPSFSQRIKLPANQGLQSVELLNPRFETLNDQELKALSGAVLTDQIQINIENKADRFSPFALVSFIPLRKNPSTGKAEKLVSFEWRHNYTSMPQLKSGRSFTYASESVLSSGTWYRLGVVRDGIYRIDRNYLINLGIDVNSIDPRNFRIFGNGGQQLSFNNQDARMDDLAENAIVVTGEEDARFDSTDFVWFYAKGPVRWNQDGSCLGFGHRIHDYSDTSYYYLTFDNGPGKRILTRSSVNSPANQVVNAFDDYAFHENELVNLVKSGRRWFGETFDIITSYNFPFTFPNVITSEPAYIKAAVAARSNPPANFTFTCQGGVLNINPPQVSLTPYYADPATVASGCVAFTPTSSNFNVNVKFNKAASFSSGIGYLDFVEVGARRQLRLVGNEMHFRDSRSVGPGNIAEFILSDVSQNSLVLDVSDLQNVSILSGDLNGNVFTFRQASDQLREYFVFNRGSNALSAPFSFGRVENQNLHGLGPIEYIIVSHPLFLNQAERLGSLHQALDGLSYVVVTPQQIYNEFSSGSQDVTAIKHFVKMFYDRAQTVEDLPKYLLLFGDASYRNRSRSIIGNTNFIPCYQSLNSNSYINSYVSDDYFGLLDDNSSEGLTDEVKVGVGRFPVQTPDEAKRVVDKIQLYLSKPPLETQQDAVCTSSTLSVSGDWRNILCFVADDQDNNLHLRNAEAIANRIDTTYRAFNIDKIYLDAFKQVSGAGGRRYPDAKEAINRRVDRGCLIINYTGHGGETGWTEERVLEVSDVNAWNNRERLPLFVTATCEFSRYDDPARTSAGELVILNGQGGGIGLLTTTRLVYANFNQTLNENFFNSVFIRDSITDKMPRLGDVCRLTKNRSANSIAVNHRNFVLLGDPAIRLHYPEEEVRTQTLNAQAISVTADTMKALSRITITGIITNRAGTKLNNFNGIIYPTVYDKKVNVFTLGNDSDSPKTTFKARKSILYKGKASVTNGDFTFTFIVPRNINFEYGPGRISYYAVDANTDAHGYNEDFIVGGTNPNAPEDAQGPEIQLYMNNTKFISGSITNESPDLLALLYDEHGINTASAGIGHDIMAILNENTSRAIVLNDYYQADLNSYQNGTIRYPFSKLEDGKHTLSLRAWDVYNNSSTEMIEFVVAESANLALQNVLNYPNPFTTYTRFMFEHNKPCETLNVMIQVFTVSGRVIKTLESVVLCDGFRSESIEWDGTDDFGDRIGRGVYVYRLKVTAPDGTWSDKYEKLVMLR
jgi:hypothetical protein